jgi:hypothetical protein
VQDALLAGTRSLVAPQGDPLVTVILDRADDLADVESVARDAVADGQPIEVRASFAGPARSAADTIAEVAVIVQQLAIGAAGSGVWAGVEMIVRSALGRKSARREGSARQPAQRQSLTVVIPTRNGPALVQRVSVGAQDLDEGQLSVERIVRALIDGSQDPPEATA